MDHIFNLRSVCVITLNRGLNTVCLFIYLVKTYSSDFLPTWVSANVNSWMRIEYLFVIRKISSLSYYYIYNFLCRKRLYAFRTLFHKRRKSLVTLAQTRVCNLSIEHVHSKYCLGTVHSTLQVSTQVRSANGPWTGNNGSDSTHNWTPPASVAWEPLCSRFTQWVEWNVAEVRVRGCSLRPQSDEWLFYVPCDIMREPWPHLSHHRDSHMAGISSRGILVVTTDIHFNFLAYEIHPS